MSGSKLLNKATIRFFAGLATAGCLEIYGVDPQIVDTPEGDSASCRKTVEESPALEESQDGFAALAPDCFRSNADAETAD